MSQANKDGDRVGAGAIKITIGEQMKTELLAMLTDEEIKQHISELEKYTKHQAGYALESTAKYRLEVKEAKDFQENRQKVKNTNPYFDTFPEYDPTRELEDHSEYMKWHATAMNQPAQDGVSMSMADFGELKRKASAFDALCELMKNILEPILAGTTFDVKVAESIERKSKAEAFEAMRRAAQGGK